MRWRWLPAGSAVQNTGAHLGLHGEAAVLGVQVGALAGEGAVEVVAGIELEAGRVGGQVHGAAAQRRVHAGCQLGPEVTTACECIQLGHCMYGCDAGC